MIANIGGGSPFSRPVAAALVAAVIGFVIGFNAGASVADGVVRAAVSAAADELRVSTYAPIIAAGVTGGCAILCAILLPVVTLVTLHSLERRAANGFDAPRVDESGCLFSKTSLSKPDSIATRKTELSCDPGYGGLIENGTRRDPARDKHHRQT